MNAHFTTLMDQLDDIKDNMTEGQYLSFCNALRDAKVLADSSNMYKITFVEASIAMNHFTIPVIAPRVIKRTINPYEFFCSINPSHIPMKLDKIMETISRQGFAKATHSSTNCYSDDDTVILLPWEEEDMTVRLDQSKNIIILSLVQVNGDPPKTKPEVSMDLNLFKKISTNIQEGIWFFKTVNSISSIVDSEGRQQVAQTDSGDFVQIVYATDA